MVSAQRNMRIPAELVPYCPVCGRPMTMNLRCDDTVVEDAGWHSAAARYKAFLARHKGRAVLYLELGVCFNTPGIIKYPFWQMAHQNGNALYACITLGDAYVPGEISSRSLCLDADIAQVLRDMKA